MKGGFLRRCPAISGVTTLHPALIFISPFYLFGKLRVDMIENIDYDKINVRFRDRSLAGIAGKEDFDQQIEDFQNLVAYGQVGHIDKIDPDVALIRSSDLADELLDFLIG
jgi:hypothetical protein